VSSPGGGGRWKGPLDYDLPSELIAQQPAPRRQDSRLLVLDRASASIEHASFADIGSFLPRRALLVANDSRVLRARLRARKQGSGGAVELLVLGLGSGSRAPVLSRSSKGLAEGQVLEVADGITATVAGPVAHGRCTVDFAPLGVSDVLERAGELPLPPYIERPGGPTDSDAERYQTVYAAAPGSVAAPTAGLHFTEQLLSELAAAGFEFATVTLHVGPGTFVPVRGAVEEHVMERESYSISPTAAAAVARARQARRAVVAIGTTTVRTLESAADEQGALRTEPSSTDLFIRPGHRFRVVDGMVTNFHLPGSTLLALVMAMAGRELIERAYQEAIAARYRFYSYGDAMLIR